MADHRKTNIAALSLVAVALVLMPLAPARSADQPVKLGVITSLTGAAALIGFTQSLGVRIAVEEVNAEGGILGRPITIVSADDQSDATQAVSEMKRLVNLEKVDAVYGPSIAQLLLATAPVLTEAKIPSIAASGIDTNALPYGFMMTQPVDAVARLMAEYAAHGLKVKRVAILTDTAAYAKAGLEPLKEAVASNGLALTEVQQHEYRTPDLTPQLLSLRRGNPEAILAIQGNGEDAGTLVKNLEEIGWDPAVVDQAFGFQTKGAMLKGGPDMFKRGNRIGVNAKTLTYCKGEAGDTPFLKLRQKALAAEPQHKDTIQLVVLAYPYDSIKLLKAAAEGTKSLSAPAIAQWIEEHAAQVTGLVSGHISANKRSHVLLGEDSLALMARPDLTDEYGRSERLGC
jgi:ABC-type branched-subunit amino acid transport system substrate-binding protein